MCGFREQVVDQARQLKKDGNGAVSTVQATIPE